MRTSTYCVSGPTQYFSPTTMPVLSKNEASREIVSFIIAVKTDVVRIAISFPELFDKF